MQTTRDELVHGYFVVQEATDRTPEVRLHYVEQGAGENRPLVILLHGFPELVFCQTHYNYGVLNRAASKAGGILELAAFPRYTL